jgi:hypothetical protein
VYDIGLIILLEQWYVLFIHELSIKLPVILLAHYHIVGPKVVDTQCIAGIFLKKQFRDLADIVGNIFELPQHHIRMCLHVSSRTRSAPII